MIWYHWCSPRKLLGVALCWRILWGRHDSPFVRTWSVGPLTVVFTDLDRMGVAR